ncbi:glycosyltransferase [Planctomycetota bacterium]|nr:glycosyltransferase [Planctomycetota bacterium]
MIDLEGNAALILGYAEPPLPPIVNAGPLAVLARAPLDLEVAPAYESGLPAGGALDPAVVALAPEHAVIYTVHRVDPRGVLLALRYGCRTFHFVDCTGESFRSNARGALVVAMRTASRRRVAKRPLLAQPLEAVLGQRLDPPWPSAASSARAIADVVNFAQRDPDLPRALPAQGPLRIVHLVGQLGAGGAERQLTYLAKASREVGCQVEVLTQLPLSGANSHYASELQAAGVPCSALSRRSPHDPLPELRDAAGRPLPAHLVRTLDMHAGREALIPLVEHLLADPPDVLHCWLDDTNVIGGLAGLVAGVARVLISTRNVNPSNFPRFYKAWFRDAYRLLAESGRVVVVANSQAGADDYAAWAGVDPARFDVVYNGFPLESVPAPTDEERSALRAELGIPPRGLRDRRRVSP